ncbi:MAG: zinc ribbon domain-containing protein [Candidatus Krumholzibacteria bacterium]|nr:zinc ribbon domain-containing protein [Candidatus Krumholzibacteria bacterium]
MYCKHCGMEVEEKAELCVHCGRRLRSSFSTFLDNSELTQLRPQQSNKSPGLAGFLGFILGWILLGPVGYLYLGQWNWFWITIVITIIAYPLTVGIAYVVFPFIFAFHQYQMAKELNDLYEQNRSPGKTPPGGYDSGGTEARAPHESS